MWHDAERGAGVLRVPRTRPRRRGAVHRRTQAPAGPHPAVRRQDRVPQGHPQLRRGAHARRRRPSSTRPSTSPSRPAIRLSLSFADDDAVDVQSAANGAEGRPSKPVTVKSDEQGEFVLDHGAVVVAGDHVVHQHLQPVGDARRRAAGQQRRREGPDVQAVGEDLDGAGLAGGHRLLQQGRPVAVPGEARLLPGRLRLHHLHRQHRPAARRDLEGDQRQRPLGHRGAVGQPQLRGPHLPRREDELPGLSAAGHRLRARRHHGLRLRDRRRSARTTTATTSS